MIVPSFAPLLAIVGLALVAEASTQPGFVHRRHPAPAPRSGAGPRTFDITKRAPSHHEAAQLGVGAQKREVKSAQGGMAVPLQVRAKTPKTTTANGGKPIKVQHGIKTGTTKMQQQSAQKGDPSKLPQDDGGDAGAAGGSGGGTGTPSSANPPVIMDVDLSFNVTLAGTPVVMVLGGNEVIAPGTDNPETPFTAPAEGDTSLKWQRLKFGGRVFKGDVVFGDGAYTAKDIAYGTTEAEGTTKGYGQFGIGIPGQQAEFPQGSPPSLAEALVDQFNITSWSVAVLDDWTLLLGQDPFVDVDPKALAGQVAPSDVGWHVKATFNGTDILTDLEPSNKQIYGDAAVVQKFFGDQKPVNKEGHDGINYYEAPCDGGPVPLFTFGDTSENGDGLSVTLSGEASVFTDKDSSTGCFSVVVGTDPDPDSFALSWSIGNAFQYHFTPSYHFEDPKNPSIQFFGRPESMYPQYDIYCYFARLDS